MTACLQRLAATRDPDAFAALFDFYAPRVKAYLMRLGAGAEAAEEMAQDTMILVWRKADRFDPGKAAAGTWIFTIARNRWIDAVRRERRPEIDPDDPALAGDPAAPADARIDVEQRRDRIRAAMARLPPEQAQVVRLSFFEDKPHSLIARELGLPLGTVKSRLRLAFQRLRAAVAEEP